MSLPPEIQRLIDRFQDDEQRLLSSGRRSSYNETEARIHYINPLFVALGWDMDLHRRHAAEGNPQMKTMLQRQIDAKRTPVRRRADRWAGVCVVWVDGRGDWDCGGVLDLTGFRKPVRSCGSVRS